MIVLLIYLAISGFIVGVIIAVVLLAIWSRIARGRARTI